MQNIPVFTTENGIASLVLREIPYREEAYVRFHSVSDPVKFTEDCISLCRAAGAKKIFASGEKFLTTYPLYTKILRMEASKSSLPDTGAAAAEVTEETLDAWRRFYNRKMADVPNAAYMTAEDGMGMLREHKGYFVYEKDLLLGIASGTGSQIEVIASAVPGRGRDVLLGLCAMLSGDRLILETASANHRAVRLYEGLGFAVTGELGCWYKIFPVVK